MRRSDGSCQSTASPGGAPQRRNRPAGSGTGEAASHSLISAIRRDAWFIPIRPQIGIDVDICTPQVWASDDRVESFDLDLDVAAAHDGTVSVLDEGELDDPCSL